MVVIPVENVGEDRCRYATGELEASGESPFPASHLARQIV